MLNKFGGLLRCDKTIPIFCLLTRILGQFFNFTLQKNQMAERNVWMPKRCGSWPNFWLSLSDQPHQMFFLATASLHLHQLQLANVHFIWDKQMGLMETKLCGFVLKCPPTVPSISIFSRLFSERSRKQDEPSADNVSPVETETRLTFLAQNESRNISDESVCRLATSKS